MNTFANLETFLTGELHHLLATHLIVFSSKMVVLLRLGLVILVLYYGYSIMIPRGSNATVPEMFFNFARIGLVLAFVQNSEGLLDSAIGFIQELKTGFIEEKSLFALLDEQFLTAQKLSQTVRKLDTAIVPLQGVVASSMIWFGSIFVLTSSAIVFIAAEVSLALLTATSPIFIGCLTYNFTRELFNGWLRSVFSCIITLIFATLIVKVGIDINRDTLVQLATAPAQESLMTIGAIALGLGIIISSLILVAAKMAGNIAGVAATSAIQGGMALATKAGMVGTIKTGVTAGKGTVAAVKYARNKASDMRERRNSTFKRLQQENSKSNP